MAFAAARFWGSKRKRCRHGDDARWLIRAAGPVGGITGFHHPTRLAQVGDSRIIICSGPAFDDAQRAWRAYSRIRSDWYPRGIKTRNSRILEFAARAIL